MLGIMSNDSLVNQTTPSTALDLATNFYANCQLPEGCGQSWDRPMMRGDHGPTRHNNNSTMSCTCTIVSQTSTHSRVSAHVVISRDHCSSFYTNVIKLYPFPPCSSFPTFLTINAHNYILILCLNSYSFNFISRSRLIAKRMKWQKWRN